MEKILLYLYSAILIIMPGVSSQAQEFKFEEYSSFVNPWNIEIRSVIFGDLQGDGVLEVLYYYGDSLVIYLPDLDGYYILKDNIPDNVKNTTRLFADVNRDNILDLLIGTCFESPPMISVEFFDGTINGSTTYTYASNIYLANEDLMRLSLCALDVNSDGYNELLMTYDSSEVNFESGDYWGTLGCKTKLYYSFPDSLMVQNNLAIGGMFGDLELFSHHGEKVFATQHSAWFTTIGYEFHHNKWHSIFDAETLDEFYFTSMLPGPDHERMILCGNMYNEYPSDEILLRTFIYNSESPTNYDTRLALYGFRDSLYLDLIWERDYSNLPDFYYMAEHVYHPEFPGTFFGIWDGCLKQFDGNNGDEIASVDFQIAPENIYWTYPLHDKRPFLYTKTGDSITLYEIQRIPTSVDDKNALPEVFSLGNPYPNPFNASQTIPVKINRIGERLEVVVFDIIGRKIETIYDNTVNNNEIEIIWNAEKFASGIYFIKATSGDKSEIVKTVLLK
ncbi:MAG: T9SS type A sorting domain-containing protein [candidate division Zixibacteria bacterium]